MIGSFVLQALALHFGDLTEVQPILVTELLFLVLMLSVWFGYRIGPREWLGVILAAGGLAGFLAFSTPTGGDRLPTNLEWAFVGGICVAGMGVAVLLALRGPRWWRAAMFGTAAADRLRVHGFAHQGGDPLHRGRLGRRSSPTGRPTRSPSSECWRCS